MSEAKKKPTAPKGRKPKVAPVTVPEVVTPPAGEPDTTEKATPDNNGHENADNGAGADNNKNDGSENKASNSANDTDKKDDPADKKNGKPKSADGWEVARVLKVTKPLMKGDDVKALQAALIAHNYHCGIEGASGTYEKHTAYAVRCFQSFHGLVVDGKAGRYTVAALGGTWTA